MLTTTQSGILARGMVATQKRVAQRGRLTLHLEWDAQLSQSVIQHTVERALEADGVIVTQVDADREATFLRNQVNRRDQQIEYLQGEIKRLNAMLDMRGEMAAETREEMTLKQWANQMNISYATAWRRVDAGCIQYRSIGNGTKHNGYMVFPDSYVAPVSAQKARKKK